MGIAADTLARLKRFFQTPSPSSLVEEGRKLKDLGRYDESEAAYLRAIRIDPGCAQAHYHLGFLLSKAGRNAESVAAFRRTLAIEPENADALNNLGSALQETGDLEEARHVLERLTQLRPDFAAAWYNLGNALQRLECFTEAEAAYRRAIALGPRLAQAHNNLGKLLQDLGRHDEAENCYRQALAGDPDKASALWNLALARLSAGDMREGWKLYYRARYDPSNPQVIVRSPGIRFPMWQGETLAGKSLLVVSEQGFGDAIQFARFLPLLKDAGASRITLACKQPLHPLLKTLRAVDELVTLDRLADAPAHDYWTFLIAIAKHLETDLATLPRRIPYLRALPEAIERWRARLPPGPFTVGLVWKGGTLNTNDRNRSLEGVHVLRPLWDIPEMRFVSLQKGRDEDAEPPMDQPFVQLGPQIHDFGDSAAVATLCDLVISVDTSTAHLAGALGKRCYVLVPRIGLDWRWFPEGEQSTWYPGVMRLFREDENRSWARVIERVAASLRSEAHQSG